MARPPISIGHVSLRVSEITRAAAFFRALGLRSVVERKELAILELRGGTHLLLFHATSKPRSGQVRSFDFMVDDVEEAHQAAAAAGLAPTQIVRDRMSAHLMFKVSDPDGHVFAVFSSHADGREV